ncbi:RNA exonuclease [Niveomyces insectorum RCEF 264]|uniref:RNA exonuclease n=1 Tax=Niveomyces insectorum RCEF 264 TaxID=1081102 RepID=A0A167ZBK9_9HYPO|nr:RNA exonuclease [Niveomyces insectorum RCEF 264]
MSAPLGILKHIPCPQGDACTAYRCLFRHAGDEQQWPLATEAGGEPSDDRHVPGPVVVETDQLRQATTQLRLSAGHTAGKARKRVKTTHGDDGGDDNDNNNNNDDGGVNVEDDVYDPASPAVVSSGTAGAQPRVVTTHDHAPGHGLVSYKVHPDGPSPHSIHAAESTHNNHRFFTSLEENKLAKPISPPPLKRKSGDLSADSSPGTPSPATMSASTAAMSTWWRSSSNSPSPKPIPGAGVGVSWYRPPKQGNTERRSSRRLSPPAASPKTPVASTALPASKSPTAATTTTAATPPPPPTINSIATSSESKQRPAAAAARKPETLNPRHLRKAPSTHEIRFKLLKMLHAEFARLNSELRAKSGVEDKDRLLLSDQQLVWMALDMEETCAVTKPIIYSNTIKHRIMHYKRMLVDQWIRERTEAVEKEQKEQRRQEPAADEPPDKEQQSEKSSTSRNSKSSSAAAAVAPPPPQELKPVDLDSGLTLPQEVAFVKEHLLTPIDRLAAYGYVPKVPSAADIQKARDAEEVSKGWEVCERCATRFQVFPGRRESDGALASGGTCTAHPGKIDYASKTYRCCGEKPGDSRGCTTSDSHVFKTTDPKRLASLWNFAKTPPNPNVPADRAVSFDCEMAYTVYGVEMVRVTATAWPHGELLLDVLVRPMGEIIDLNSRYSGVWPQDIANAQPLSPTATATATETTNTTNDAKEPRPLQIVSSPIVARDLLFSLISPETPLIGHGLENDLNTMRIVHPTLVDTVLLFPTRKGLPMRFGLRTLAEKKLGRLIQATTSTDGATIGHDSAEDARAAGDLVRFKLKEEWAAKKRDGWAFVDGVLKSP